MKLLDIENKCKLVEESLKEIGDEAASLVTKVNLGDENALKESKISQKELKCMCELRNMTEQYSKMMQGLEKTIIAILVAGGEVEAGTLKVKIDEICRRNIAWKQEFIRTNGKTALKEVYANAKEKKSLQLKIWE